MEIFGHQDAELERTRQLLGGYGSRPSAPAGESGAPATEEEGTRRGGSDLLNTLRGMLVRAGEPDAAIRVIGLRVAGAIVVAVLASGLFHSPLPLLLIGAYPFFEIGLLRRKIFQRAERFERDYTALLLSLASGVRTGLDPLVALQNAQELFPENSEIFRELGALKGEIERGASEERAVAQFAATIDHPDIQLFRSAFILSRREGSSIAECLQRLAKVTRQRQSFRRKVRGAIAMQKLSAFGIAACAVVIAIVQLSSNPAGVAKALAHPIGSKALYLGSGLVVVGLGWMLRMTRARM